MKSNFSTKFEGSYTSLKRFNQQSLSNIFQLYTWLNMWELLPFYLASTKLSSLCCPHTAAQKTRLHEDQQFSPPKDKWATIISNHYNTFFFFFKLVLCSLIKLHKQFQTEMQSNHTRTKKDKIVAKHQVQGTPEF